MSELRLKGPGPGVSNYQTMSLIHRAGARVLFPQTFPRVAQKIGPVYPPIVSVATRGNMLSAAR